jgi:hypothetical protein
MEQLLSPIFKGIDSELLKSLKIRALEKISILNFECYHTMVDFATVASQKGVLHKSTNV